MKYYRTNTLIIEYPTTFLGIPKEKSVPARITCKVAWTELASKEKIKFINKGSPMDTKGRTYQHNVILVDLHCTKEEFIDAISRHFSEKLDVKPRKLKFRFESFTPFGDLNAN